MSQTLHSESDLRTVYQDPMGGAVDKQLKRLDKHCRAFIAISPFVCIATSGADGLGDVSPRGGEPGFIHVLEDDLVAMPDRPGNNRLDTLGNLVEQPGVGLIFFVPGMNETLRINGTAETVTTPELMARFEHAGKPPRSVMLVHVKEAYLHCAKALKRARLWDPEAQIDRSTFPTLGEMVRDHAKIDAPTEIIDQLLDEDAKENLY